MKILFLLLFVLIQNFAFSQKKITVSGGGHIYSGSTKVIILSEAGISSNANLDTSSTTFGTDQTTAIQTILNTASKENPLKLIWDVKISCTGLRLKSYTTIEAAPGCGAILRDSSANWLLVNYNWVAGNNGTLDSNICINGGIWNCGGYRGGILRQEGGDTAKGLTTGFFFMGVKNLTIKNLTALNAANWLIGLANIEDMYFDNLTVDQGAAPRIGQDGITCISKMKNIVITNCKIRSGDDRIAFNPNPVRGVGSVYNVWRALDGNVSNVRIDNIYFMGAGKGFAFYVPGGNEVRDVFISNVYGTSQTYWLGMYNNLYSASNYIVTTGSNFCYNIHFENIDVEVNSYVGYGDNTYAMAELRCGVDNLSFKNVKRNIFHAGNPTFRIKTDQSQPTVIINNLIIDGYFTLNASPGNYTHLIENWATVRNFNLINTNVDVGNTVQNRALLYNLGTINNLFLSNIKFNFLKNVVNNAATIDKIVVNGIIHTGQLSTDPTIYNTGTLSNLTATNCILKQLTAGTIGAKDSSAIQVY